MCRRCRRSSTRCFADEFDSDTGVVVLLFALGMVKSDITASVADATLAAPLDRMAGVLLATRQVRVCFR